MVILEIFIFNLPWIWHRLSEQPNSIIYTFDSKILIKSKICCLFTVWLGLAYVQLKWNNFIK